MVRLPGLRALDLKVLRDAKRMLAQLLAIALVLACGVGVYVGMRSTMRTLELARERYYAAERFGDVFVRLVRAPESVAERLRAIPGVLRLETRVVTDVTLDVAGMLEPVTGRLVSLPQRGEPAINGLWLRGGRLPEPGRPREVLAGEAFAEAHALVPGDTLTALIDGRFQELEVVGTALSPEFTYSLGRQQVVPDDRSFGVLWMRREPLAAALDLEGAFNDVSALLARGASPREVIEGLDRELERYGGLGAIPRSEQPSAFFLDNELRQLATFGVFVPVLFLLVSGFLLNVVIGRIVAAQRGQIAALKSLGYRDREVGWHYTKLTALVVLAGTAGGAALGAWLGARMTRMYGDYYRFPELPFAAGPRELLEAFAISTLAAALGAWGAVRSTVRLPPAEALRPPAPEGYRPALLERMGLARLVPPAAAFVLRELERRPLRAVLTVAGIAMAAALCIVNAFSFDAVQRMLDVQFGLSQREDVQVALTRPRANAALAPLARLPGVQLVEPFRSVPVRLRAGRSARTVGLQGVPAESQLHRLLDARLQPVEILPQGIVLARKLADVLGLAAGDRLQLEVLEGSRAVVEAVVVRLAETTIGMAAYMDLDALCALLGEPRSINGARLLVDDDALPALYAEVQRTPLIAGLAERERILLRVRQLLDASIGTWVTISLGFSLAMAGGVLYNAARVTLAERAHELASLRVLGFRRREVAAMLLGELALLVAIALPLGLLLGRWLAALLARTPGYDNEQFRLPLVIAPRTYALAIAVVLVAAAFSGWSAWRKLDRMDMVEVLKARE